MKQLTVNKTHPCGIIQEMTAEAAAALQSSVVELPYEQRVAERIRQVYSIDDELAILRQRDEKPDEFNTYYAFAEMVKAEEKAR